jgi:serine/threonine-protein kinase RsbW
MTRPQVGTVPARMDCLPQAIAFVEAFCREQGVPRSDGLRVSLVVEELFTNTVAHGHGGDSDAPVRIGLSVDPLHLELIYEDTAPPFDPLDHVARSTFDLETGLSERPVGHLGIALVVSMAVRASYQRKDGRNRLRLTLLRQAPDDGDT